MKGHVCSDTEYSTACVKSQDRFMCEHACTSFISSSITKWTKPSYLYLYRLTLSVLGCSLQKSSKDNLLKSPVFLQEGNRTKTHYSLLRGPVRAIFDISNKVKRVLCEQHLKSLPRREPDCVWFSYFSLNCVHKPTTVKLWKCMFAVLGTFFTLAE